jgi:hypothetical protein
VKLPAADPKDRLGGDRPGQELEGIVRHLASVALPEADQALYALADPKHPWHALAVRGVLTARLDSHHWGGVGASWLSHPYCLAFLRRALDDKTPTGGRLTLDKEGLSRRSPSSWERLVMPDFLADRKLLKAEAAERRCDVAGLHVSLLVGGVPAYHALFKDADKRLPQLKAALDRYRGRFRRASREEAEYLRTYLGESPRSVRESSQPLFLPDFGRLDRPATPEDVKVGRAVFHLGGKGKRLSLKLPAWGVLKKDAGEKYPPRVLIVQAEATPGGKVTYGVIDRHEVRAVPGGEMGRVRPLGAKDE